jgi:hypothetical protein
VEDPSHTVAEPPVIAATTGNAFIVNGVVTLVEQPSVATVYSTVTFPAVKPETTPDALIVAVPVPLAIDQTPAAVAFAKAGVEDPSHTVAEPPVIAATTDNAFIVNGVVTFVEQPSVVTVYSTVTFPAVKPETTPDALTVAVPVPLVIDQIPVAVAFAKAGVEDPSHTVAEPPVIGATTGNAFIVNGVVTFVEQPSVVTVYSTVTFPAVKPETTPDALIVAVPVPLVIDQTPAVVAFAKAGVEDPSHTVAEPPVIGATTGNVVLPETITVAVVELQPEPSALVTTKL